MQDELISLRKLQVLSWLLLVILVAGSWVVMGRDFSWSVAAGGALSILSFLSTKRDVAEFMNSLEAPVEQEEAEEEQEERKPPKGGKARYIIKFWLRLAIIGLVLLLLIKSGKANVFGLLVGLSTVVFTITLSSVFAAGRYFISRRR